MKTHHKIAYLLSLLHVETFWAERDRTHYNIIRLKELFFFTTVFCKVFDIVLLRHMDTLPVYLSRFRVCRSHRDQARFDINL